jgi:hypothetical protein
MAEVMRASRTVENEVIIAPAHVTASAILHAYQLLATAARNRSTCWSRRTASTRSTSSPARSCTAAAGFAAQTMLAKGLLTESGVKLSQFAKVTYGNTSGGGLVALGFGMADVTIADETQAKE